MMFPGPRCHRIRSSWTVRRVVHHTAVPVFILVLMLQGCSLPAVMRGEGLPRAAMHDESGTNGKDVAEAPRPSTAPSASGTNKGPLRLTLKAAILMGLDNNRALRVERLAPRIRQTFAQQEAGVFDTVLDADASAGKTVSQRRTVGDQDVVSVDDTDLAGEIALSRYFPSGTTVSVSGALDAQDPDAEDSALYAARLGLGLTQALLRGASPQANLAEVRLAQLDTRISAYELRGFSERLLAAIEQAYWDYALAQRRIDIVTKSLNVAKQQLRETQDLIAVGKLAESELTAAQAEVALQEQGRINAESALQTARLELLRLLNPPEGPQGDFWERKIELIHPPALPDVQLGSPSEHTAVARRLRPEIHQAELEVRRGEIEIARTRNGLLPVLDIFLTLGKSGYADTFGRALDDFGGDSYDIAGGLNFLFPLDNRQARARYRRAHLQERRAQEALDNLNQLIALDVRTAMIDVRRARQQITATQATRRLQEEKLRVEREKFRVGRSTNYLVAQAQRDLLQSRISEVEALANYLKALTHFYRMEGTLLMRRGIDT